MATGVYQLNGVVQKAPPPPGVWIDADLRPSGLPETAVAVDLRGILIITDGANTDDASIAMAFEQPGGSQSVANYEVQALGVLSTGGAREPASLIAPAVGGFIRYSWYRGNSNGEWPANPLKAAYPQGAAYGFNLNMYQIFMP